MGGSTSKVIYKDSLYLLLANNRNNLITQVVNVPYIEGDPRNGFKLLHFYYYGFKQATYSARNKIMLKENTRSRHNIPVSHKKNGVGFITMYFTQPNTPIQRSNNVFQVNNVLESREIHLYASSKTLHKTCASNYITRMPCVSSSSINFPTCLTCKMTKFQPASSETKRM